MERLTEKEKDILVNVLLSKINEIYGLSGGLFTEEAKNSVIEEAEKIRKILQVLTSEDKTKDRGDYYISLFDGKSGEEIAMGLSPFWYGISRDTMKGILFGMRGTSKRKNAQARAYELHGQTRGELVRVIS